MGKKIKRIIFDAVHELSLQTKHFTKSFVYIVNLLIWRLNICYEHQENVKIERILQVYTDLMNGRIVNKAEVAAKYGVTEKSIQRDIDDIRNFLELQVSQSGILNSVIYDSRKKGYRLE